QRARPPRGGDHSHARGPAAAAGRQAARRRVVELAHHAFLPARGRNADRASATDDGPPAGGGGSELGPTAAAAAAYTARCAAGRRAAAAQAAPGQRRPDMIPTVRRPAVAWRPMIISSVAAAL